MKMILVSAAKVGRARQSASEAMRSFVFITLRIRCPGRGIIHGHAGNVCRRLLLLVILLRLPDPAMEQD
jgi:hypothetical protein